MTSLAGLGDTIILLGIIQGSILTALLFFSGKRSLPNRILAVLILFITTCSLNLYLLSGPFLSSLPVFFSILADALPLVLVIPMGPLIWLYVQASLDSDFRLSRKHIRHFYTSLLDLVPYFLVLVFDIARLTNLASAAQRSWISHFVDDYNVYGDIPRWMSITVYLWLSRRYILQRKQQQLQMPEKMARWVQQFLQLFLGFQCIWFLYLVPYIIPATRDWLLNTVDWYPVFIPLAVLVYWLGLKGYLVTQKHPPIAHPKSALPVSRIPQSALEQVVQQLKTAMEQDRLYLDPALSVNGLAQHTGIAPKTVSAALNQHLDKSFSSFVNEYRVAAFKKKIQEPDTQHLTITGVAMECGFSSTATFQRIFKQLTGVSPSGFMQQSKAGEMQ
jgi:AraC-like DNA-binding protein